MLNESLITCRSLKAQRCLGSPAPGASSKQSLGTSLGKQIFLPGMITRGTNSPVDGEQIFYGTWLNYSNRINYGYSKPSTQLMPWTSNNINGCHATSHRIQSSNWPYRTCGLSHLKENSECLWNNSFVNVGQQLTDYWINVSNRLSPYNMDTFAFYQ